MLADVLHLSTLFVIHHGSQKLDHPLPRIKIRREPGDDGNSSRRNTTMT